ncbi:hypothetical protein M3591_01310 [Exiguobacterium sp. MER 193]|uniref:hypothetical protein n=1 Tax=Exiguobacterium sp. MER 193 TaxID=2939564 RepID=UPI00203A4AAC|nr:hypothetical protein [Exiguobacterium sp. MER 193]MCM3279165.1 hypothetical protein [Exiguobacterium sp. MER 193]
MKRSYVLYTTLCAVVVGVILCYVFVFSDEEIQRQVTSTFEKIDIQTSHQTASLPPVEAAQDDEDIDTTDALEQISQIDEVYYSDTIGAYLVLTEQAEFFEVSGNGTRVNSVLQLENSGKQRLDDFIGMRMVEEDLVYAVTANGTLITIEREEGRWVERPRKQIKGLVSEDRIFGLGYDRKTKRLFMMNRLADTPDLELLYVEEREIEPETPADDKSSEAPTDADTTTQDTEESSEDTTTENVSTNDNASSETAATEDAPDNESNEKEAEEEKQEPETEWMLDSRQALSADGMSASIQQKFERFEGVGLVERQGRVYVLDSEELVLYTINPEERTINGQMVTPRVYDSTGMFLQDNEIFAIVHPEVFDLDAFVSVD